MESNIRAASYITWFNSPKGLKELFKYTVPNLQMNTKGWAFLQRSWGGCNNLVKTSKCNLNSSRGQKPARKMNSVRSLKTKIDTL
jgi:hypothetical protein